MSRPVPQVDESVAGVLAGAGDFDQLDERQQAIVRKQWVARMAKLRQNLDYATPPLAQGDTYSEADQDGDVVVRSVDNQTAQVIGQRVGPTGARRK